MDSTKKVKMNEYSKKYYQANKEKWKVIKHCDLCDVDYNSSASNHLHTKNHKIKELEMQINNKKIDILSL